MRMKMQAHRHYTFCYGHRVFGHESKCACLHGHNGGVDWYCEADSLDQVGRVIDFSEIKRMDMWVEENWDHKTLIWEKDPWFPQLQFIDPVGVISVPFNPTSENISLYLLDVIGPLVLADTGVSLTKVQFMETEKCGVTFEKGGKI